jgi:hypothetical protein
MLARDRREPSTASSSPSAHSGPQHLRIVGGQQALRLDRRQDEQERRRRPPVRRLLNKGSHDAAQPRPHRGGQPDHRGADQHRRAHPVAARTATTWRSSRRSARPRRAMDEDAARRTRTVIMFLGPCCTTRLLPPAVCRWLRPGTRTVEPHLRPLRQALRARRGGDARLLRGAVDPPVGPDAIVLTERGDTVTENALMAAARNPGTTIIRNASPNYMVQDLCFFLAALGVTIEGIGTTTLTRQGRPSTSTSTSSTPERGPDRGDEPDRRRRRHRVEITIRAGADRVPRDRAGHPASEMGMRYDLTPEYPANGRPGWSTSRPPRGRCRPRSTRSTRCPSPGSTSTTCRSSPSSQRCARARR